MPKERAFKTLVIPCLYISRYLDMIDPLKKITITVDVYIINAVKRTLLKNKP